MPDRVVESHFDKVPDVPEELLRVLQFCLADAKERMEKGEEIGPFTALAVQDKLFTEGQDDDTPALSYARARKTVGTARGADAYGFCYDGYIEADDMTLDAIIAEGGVPGEERGYAFAHVYRMKDDGTPEFEPSPTFLGMAPNFMAGLVELEEEDDLEFSELAQEEQQTEPEAASEEGESVPSEEESPTDDSE